MIETAQLGQEVAIFEQYRADYLQRFPGLFVLIKGDRRRGPFPTAEAAYEQGLREFGLVPFLVRQVLAEEPIAFAPLLSSYPKPDARL